MLLCQEVFEPVDFLECLAVDSLSREMVEPLLEAIENVCLGVRCLDQMRELTFELNLEDAWIHE